ncbi:MAG: hypothetical protein Q7S81_02920 [bacterium]|nr:hypothetical protein [bacterium]
MIKISNKIHRFYTKTASRYGKGILFGLFALSLSINSTALAISHNPETGKAMNQIEVELTAYSSTKDQTDSTPFISASGKRVYDGMVAANFLPFGTKIKIPELFGDKIFTVDDRMNRRYQNRVDIWFADRTSAINFGIKNSVIEIVPTVD